MPHKAGQSGPADTVKPKTGRRLRLLDEKPLKLFAFVAQNGCDVPGDGRVGWATLGKSMDRPTLYNFLKSCVILTRQLRKTPFGAPVPDVFAPPGDSAPMQRYRDKRDHRSPDARTTDPSRPTDAE